MSDMVYYILCSFLIIGVLCGIALMSKVKHSLKGNLLSSVCMALAILITLYKYNIMSDLSLWICIAAGLVMGLWGAYKVKMINMPQVVAMLNGFGGAASAIVASIALLENQTANLFSFITGGIALGVGTVTLTGSLVAGGKLQGILPQKPVFWKKHSFIISSSLMIIVMSVLAIAISGTDRTILSVMVALCVVFSGFFGLAFTIRVGGADMPITISLLNSLSGVAGAIAGMVISDPLLISVGGVVGASGLLLTQIMCNAMNRPLKDILLGKSTVGSQGTGHGNSDESVTNISEQEAPEPMNSEKETQKTDPAAILSEAKKVIIVPGYGMALAQAQEQVKQLTDKLEEKGAEVLFAIHPVAGRMPGHMNVLLCEVDIPYEKLCEMDEINPRFKECDVALVVGANDVVNPAANTAIGTPIYGMPVLEVDKARHIIICNYDLKPGYAGVENPLYRRKEGVTLLLGDARDTIEKLISKIQTGL
ncbi:MAG: NAD(P)(+) transhydrogenase (Re/Si-specific) subunit beta [Clostridiaceae bacterium]|jgi:NAD(P) transhydrogenase subunit beta|nr:NAD(P)(+) transhydrogenase (Re/Si-specific) subunit beta [Clostridiaceae bacterium]